MSIRAAKNLNDILMILSAMSGLLFFAAATIGIFDSSWPVRMYFALTATVFDCIFVLEFLARVCGLLKSSLDNPRLKAFETALLALVSLVPFVFVSGPFLLGWIKSDFAAASVRGYWTSMQPLAALGIFGFFRLGRLFRPFIGLFSGCRFKKSLLLSLALITGFGCIVGILVETMIFPGYRNTQRNTRTVLTGRVQNLSMADTLAIARTSPDILAVSVDGRAVFSRPDTKAIPPGDYEFFSAGSVGIWYSVVSVHRIRSVTETAASAYACILAAALALFLRAVKRDELKKTMYPLKNPDGTNLPVGKEELDGILGKSR